MAKKGIVKIPSSATKIGYFLGVTLRNMFDECEYIEGINVAEGNPNFCSIDGLLCEKTDDGDIALVVYPKAKGNDIVIPDGITSVENIFYDRSDITSVFIGGNVKQIINPAINSSFYEGAPPILYDGAFTAFDITNIKNIRACSESF